MKTMKRVAAMLLLVAVAVGCAGCGKAMHKLTEAEKKVQNVAIQNLTTGEIIYLGMPQEQVAAVAGEVVEKNDIGPTYADALCVRAREEVFYLNVLRLDKTKGEKLNYQLATGAKQGMLLKDLRKIYGDQLMSFDERHLFVMLHYEEGQWVIPDVSPEEAYDLSFQRSSLVEEIEEWHDWAVIRFFIKEDKIVSFMLYFVDMF